MIPESIKANKIIDDPGGEASEKTGAGGGTDLKRGDLLKLRRAVESGIYEITPEMRTKWLAEASRLATGAEEERVRARAIDLCRAFDADNVKRLEVVDKLNRLDNEQPTEITHGVQVVISEIDGPKSEPYTPGEGAAT